MPRHVPARREAEVLPAAPRGRRTATAELSASRPTPNGFFTSYDTDGRFVTLLRRQPPALRRQRRQGDGVGEGRLSARSPSCSRASSRRSIRRSSADARRAPGRGSRRRSTTSSTPRVDDVVRLTPTIVEVVVARPPPRGTSIRASSTGCRTTNRSRAASADDAAADGGHRADRRVGRQGEGPAVAHRARARRARAGSCAYLKTGEPVVVMGPTGAPTEIPDDENVLLLGGGLGNAVLFSIAKAMREHGNRVDLLRRLQEGRGPLQARGDRGGDRPGDLEHRHAARRSPPRRPQDAHFRGNIVQAMLAYSAGELGDAARAAVDGRAHHRHRLGPHDGGRQGGARTACSRRT